MIEINGAQGEGGGQILRTSLTLSALTGKPLHIHHIRARRSQPGLRPQHLAAVKAIAKLTGAEVSGDALNSPELTLAPAKLRTGRFRFDIPTAGSLTLLLQTVFLPLNLAPGTSEITLTGGTHVPWSPIFHYLDDQWLPTLSDCGFRADLTLIKAGFYPHGGGEMQVRILPPKDLRPFVGIGRGPLAQIHGVSGVANLSDEIAQRQKHQALRRLTPLCRETKIKTTRLPSPGKGTFLQLTAHFGNGGRACFSALGARGKPAEQVADEAVDQLLSFLETDGFVDQYLADQLLLPLLAINADSAFSTSRITPHLMTNAEVINHFLPGRVRIDGAQGESGQVHVSGGLLR
ncbi:MAG: RNA 3'-terminal phosphate cyclase [Brevefilum sp.]